MQRGYLLFPITLLLLYFPAIGFSHQSANAQDVSIDWTHYHNHAETTKILKDLAKNYKSLCKVYSIGNSFQGKDLWCMEITNYGTVAPEAKPGM